MHSTSLLQSLQDLSIMLRILNSMVFKSVQYLALGLFFNFLILLSPPLSTWPSFCSSRKPLAISFTWYQFSSVQSLSRVRLFATPWIAARQASLSITNSRSSLRLTSIESVMPSSHSSSGVPFSSCPQSLTASESFPMSQLFAWGELSKEVSKRQNPYPTDGHGSLKCFYIQIPLLLLLFLWFRQAI